MAIYSGYPRIRYFKGKKKEAAENCFARNIFEICPQYHLLINLNNTSLSSIISKNN